MGGAGWECDKSLLAARLGSPALGTGVGAGGRGQTISATPRRYSATSAPTVSIRASIPAHISGDTRTAASLQRTISSLA